MVNDDALNLVLLLAVAALGIGVRSVDLFRRADPRVTPTNSPVCRRLLNEVLKEQLKLQEFLLEEHLFLSTHVTLRRVSVKVENLLRSALHSEPKLELRSGTEAPVLRRWLFVRVCRLRLVRRRVRRLKMQKKRETVHKRANGQLNATTDLS